MNKKHETNKQLDPTFILDYKIGADRTRVYSAWTDLDLFKKWFCP